ncbi:tetratricopeptide repeat protein [Gloeobacter kilaueensis]|uniref:TPR repeat-containing protein n=1 Tax=Gloeobacter kilaueensis (strain ATCC BAA-2537 / CCAP 1431/1 / ULC 316 / JS1) TaxID=1183438 RepID=U5QJN6_GLOK1|nr:tetratricopeptide repeat protein [Gloeobacter kilaueensis]AGY59103.1 TPR repeat-containing protein [Gloeobacter kilaueensis JS1]
MVFAAQPLDALELARQCFQAGDLDRAALLFAQVLQTQPEQPGALNGLGVVAFQRQEFATAAEWFTRALAVEPASAKVQTNLGNALSALEQLEEALVCYQKAIALDAEFVLAHFNLANLLVRQERFAEATAEYRRTIILQPGFLEPHLRLANVLQDLDRIPEAIAVYRDAIALNPEMAELHNELGDALESQGEWEAAASCYREALRLQPDWAEVHNNLGNVLKEQQQLAEATVSYRRALECNPQLVAALYNLGNVLLNQRQFTEAAAVLRQALALDPNLAAAHGDLGTALTELGQLDAAQEEYQQSLVLDPDCAQTHCNHACLRMLHGELQAGLAESEWRWQTPLFLKNQRDFIQPAWDGTDPVGQRILIRAEQGFGDMIQFVRFASALKALGATVIFEGYAPLLPLLSSCPDIDELVLFGTALPPYDLHAAMMSLPLLLGTTVETIPAPVPYLRAPVRSKLPAELQIALTGEQRLKVGIVWAPGLRFFLDYKRYCPLEHFAPLFAFENIAFFSLYKGERAAELAAYGERITDVGSHCTDFADTAWAIDKLDLVITVDTAVAHLAGAMGKPVWILLPRVPDWRWLLERPDSPWYPTARLFRQPTPEEWTAVLENVAAALQERASQSSQLALLDRQVQAMLEEVAGHLEAGRPEQAAALCQRALALQPQRAEIHNDLGIALMDQGKYQQAEAACRRAIALQPNFAPAHSNLSQVLKELGRLNEAVASCRQAVALQPGWPELHFNLGELLECQANFEAAEASYREGVRLAPNLADGYTSLGFALQEQGKFGEALDCYAQALQLDPEAAQAHFNRATVLLLLAEFKEGWAEFEWRRELPLYSAFARHFSQPRWDGDYQALKGKTLFIQAEGGFGDAIQFVRYAAQLQAAGARVIVECLPALQPLLATCAGIDQLATPGEALPPFDAHALLLSLPGITEARIETIPRDVPYLRAPETCRLPEHLQQSLNGSKSAPRVGIVWSAKQLFYSDHKRYCPLEHFAPLVAFENIAFFSLYKGERAAELAAYGERITDVGSHCADFADTAWAIDKLDLVITVDTAVAHLAGAMGKPVWILLPHVPDWRWLLERPDSPWYPTARLFRQPAPGDWTSVLAQVSGDLQVHF